MQEMNRKSAFDIQIILFTALVLGTAAALIPVRSLLFERIETIKDDGIGGLQALIGKNVSFDSMGLSILNTLDIKNITIHGGDDDLFPLITVKRLRIHYSPLKLLFPPKATGEGGPLAALKAVTVEGLLVESGTAKDFDELFSGGSGKANGALKFLEYINKAAGMIPDKLKLRVSGSVFRFTAGKSVIEADGIALSAKITGDILRFRLSTEAKMRLEKPMRSEATLRARIDGVYDTRNGKSGLKIGLASVKTSFFTMNKLILLASLTENTLKLQKIGDLEPFDLSLSYNFTDSGIKAGAQFENFRLSRLLRFSPELKSWNNWLGTRVSGKMSASFNVADGLSYTAVLHGGLDRNSPVGAGNFKLDAAGGASNAYFRNLSLSLSRGELVWTGGINFRPFMPNGSLTVNDFNFTKSGLKENAGSLNGDFHVSSYGNTITLFADTFSVGATTAGVATSGVGATSGIGATAGVATAGGGENSRKTGVDLQAFDITITHTGNEFDFSVSGFRIGNAETYDEASFSPISAEGSFDLDSKNIEIRLEVEAFSLYDLLKMAGCAVELPKFPTPAWNFLDNILVTSEIFVSTDFKDLLYNVPHLIVAWRGDNDIWASLSLSGTEMSFELSESHIVWEGGGMDISARGDFADINDILFNAELRVADSVYTIQAMLLDKSALHISSSFGLNLNVSRSPYGSYAGLLFLNAPRFPMGDGFAELTAEAGFRYENPALWDFNLERFKISGIKSSLSSSAAVELMGHANQDGAEFNRIYFDDGRGALYGDASGSWKGFFNDRDAVIIGDFNLRDVGGVETVDAQLRYAEESLFVWAEVAGLQSGRFFNSADNMFITGDIGFFKTRENWSAAFDLSSLRGIFQGQPITLSGRGSLDNTRLDLSETILRYGDFSADIPFLNINLPQSDLNMAARLWSDTPDLNFNADINASAGFAQIDSWLNIGAALKSFDGVINFENTRFNTFESGEIFNFSFSRQNQIWNLEGGPNNMIRLHMNGDGDFFAAFSYPSPVLGALTGFIKNGRIDAEVSGLYIDVSSLWRYIPMDKITISGGFIIADIHIRGPLRDPEFFGAAQANSLRLGVPGFLADEIVPTPAFLTFSGSEIRLEPLNVRIGEGEGALSGSMHISRWRPSSFDVALVIEQADPIPLDLNIAGFLVMGTAFGILNISSDGQILRVFGDVGSDNAEISLAAEETASRNGDSRERGMPIQTDIKITAGRKIEFLWPNIDIPILQAYASSGSSIKVVSDNLSGHFSINGDVGIRGGEVFYFQRSFYIKEGSMSFNESELQFDPRFTAIAETRDRTNNEPVTISMIIDNQPLRSFTPRFEAAPSLSQIEIFTLLGDKLSGTPTAENAINRAFVSSTADLLAQFGFVRQFEKTIRDILHIDMFSLRTQAVQNALLLNVFRDTEGEHSENQLQSQTPPQTDIRFGNYFDNTTVFLGKYIGAGLFVQAMLSLRYDQFRTDMGGLWIEPDLSMELKGPLFDIRWDLVPTHPENLWINDNKITLSKKWTLP
jgi:hypothetical protein